MTLLRGGIVINPEEFPHSWLAQRLRLDVLESELLLQARLANTIAFASLHGHPAADIEKGAAQASQMYSRALSAVPYFSIGNGAAGQSVMAARMKAVERWHEMVKKDKPELK